MINAQLAYARRKAIAALAAVSNNELSLLSLFERAYVLDILPLAPELSNVRNSLSKQLDSAMQPGLISHGPLAEVFAVLTALWRYDSSLVSGEHLAFAIRRLISCEIKTGGPYHDPTSATLDANIYIARFMQLAAQPLPGVQTFLQSKMNNHDFSATNLTQPYLIQLLGQIPEHTLAGYATAMCVHPVWQSPLHRALAYRILSNQLPHVDQLRILTALCEQQQASGIWHDMPLLQADHKNTNRITVTAAMLAMLPTHQRQDNPLAPTLHQKHHAIVHEARQVFNVHTEPLRSLALIAVEQVCAADKNFEITLLPYFFSDAIKTPSVLTNQQYVALCLASVCGWIAYTLYDDIIDRETGPANLPIANIAMRNSLHYFRQALPGQTALHAYVRNVFTAMDEANMWEITNCRFDIKNNTIIISELPAYRRGAILAERAFAHALAPMAILTCCGLRKKSFRHMESAFRHYLIARQLNDDMHDWQKDASMGQASYVVTAILRDMRIRPGRHSLQPLLALMQQHFTQTVFAVLCHRILCHLAQARNHFIKSRALRPNNRIYALLDNLENSVRTSLITHNQAKSFCDVGNRLGW